MLPIMTVYCSERDFLLYIIDYFLQTTSAAINMTNKNVNLNVEHDIITRDANSVSWAEQKHENFKVATWHYLCRHHLKNNCIWDDLLCCLLFCSWIYTSNWTTIQYGRQMRHQAILQTESETESWLLQQHRYNYFLYFSFCFILIISRLTELRPFKYQGHPVSLWHWPLTYNLERCFSWRFSFDMYNLERLLRYLNLLTRHCTCNLLPEPTSTKHECRGKLWGHPVTSSMTSSPWKRLFWHHLGRSLNIWGQIAAAFNILKFVKWPPFSGRDKLFYWMLYRKLNIPAR